jgi:hypothetical protein
MYNKIISSTFASLLLLVPVAEVFAEPVTFEISATVDNIYDPGNAFQNTVVTGDKITGTYTIDIEVPDNDPDLQYGHYIFDPTSTQLGFDFLLNNISLKSDPATSSHMYEAYTMNSSSDHFGIISHRNMPLNSGGSVDDIFVDLYDSTGHAITSDVLSGQAPNISAFEYHVVHVSGSANNGNYYYLGAKIDSIQVVDTQSQCLSGSSNIVTFNVGATVREIYDYDNVLGNTINVGDTINGSYTFNTDTPDSNSIPEDGFYEHTPGSGSYGFDINIANTNLKSNTSTTDMFNIFIGDANGSFTWDRYIVESYGSQLPFVNGTVVDNMGIYIDDPSGNTVTSTSLTDQPPALIGTGYKDLYIGGMGATPYSSYFTIVATVDSITAACNEPHDPIVVSPASGVFDVMQYFDAAIVMDAGLAPLAYMQATNNGIDMTPQLSGCFPGTPNSQNRQTFVCPGFSSLLMPGNNSFNFTFHLGDGSTINHSVNWQLLGY